MSQTIDYRRARSLMTPEERQAFGGIQDERLDALCLRVLAREAATRGARGGASNTVEQLLAIETEGGIAPDMRRIIQGEREGLQSAIQTGDATSIAARRREAIETAGLWGRDIS